MKPGSQMFFWGKTALAAALAAIATGAAFAAWLNNGADMLASMFQAGLAWCM
jgi:hypothetical protein